MYKTVARGQLLALGVDIQVGDEVGDGLEVAGFEYAGVVVAAGEWLPDFCGSLADLEEAAHVARSMVKNQSVFQAWMGKVDLGTYGTISSWRPERKSIGTSVIEGRYMSEFQV